MTRARAHTTHTHSHLCTYPSTLLRPSRLRFPRLPPPSPLHSDALTHALRRQVRYWDVRTSVATGRAPAASLLPSDSVHRPDRRLLAESDFKAAQVGGSEREGGMEREGAGLGASEGEGEIERERVSANTRWRMFRPQKLVPRRESCEGRACASERGVEGGGKRWDVRVRGNARGGRGCCYCGGGGGSQERSGRQSSPDVTSGASL